MHKNYILKSVAFDQAGGGFAILAASTSRRNSIVSLDVYVHTAGGCTIEDSGGTIFTIAATDPVGSYKHFDFGDGKAITGDLVCNGGGKLSGTVVYYEGL
jgi:hypothetical protein